VFPFDFWLGWNGIVAGRRKRRMRMSFSLRRKKISITVHRRKRMGN